MKCKICNKRFELKKENKYLVREKYGLCDLGKPMTTYEAFDCPYCGCQNVMHVRMPEVDPHETISTSN